MRTSRALVAASDGAYGAVMRPVEGTILTVVRESSVGATEAAGRGASLLEVVEAARAASRTTLSRTPDMLPVLKEAGVVDAGDGLRALPRHLPARARRPPVAFPSPTSATRPASEPAFTERMQGLHASGEHDVSGLRYEVMYFLEAPDETIPAFKDVWAGIGDSIVVVGGDEPTTATSTPTTSGPPSRRPSRSGGRQDPRVTDLLEEIEEERWVRRRR